MHQAVAVVVVVFFFAHGCHHTTKDDQTKLDRLMKGLDAFLERDHDRAVFDFKTRHKPPTSNASGQS